MGTTVKSKIQKLLENYELSDSGGVEAALAVASPLEHSTELDEFLAGLSKHREEHDEDDDGATDVTSEPDRDVARPSNRSTQYIYLERKVLQLMADNKSLALTLEQTVRRKDLQIAELQGHLNTVVQEMQDRQKEVESRAPILALKTEEFREQLKDLRISDARYAELKGMPAGSLHVIDEVKMAVYAAKSEMHKENERLRLTIAAARESAARAEEQAARLRVENSRVNAALVEQERDLQLATEGLQARVERLASELEASMVRCELLAAKGQMYDELQARTNKLQDDNQRLQVVEANFKRMEQQCHELQLFSKEKEHTHDMLVTDKAYLSKQVDFMTDTQARLQSDLEASRAKVAELQKQRQELYDRLMQTETSRCKAEEARVQRELAALQASMSANMEKIRVETAEAYEREARLLRELRDQAQEDAGRAKVALSELQDVHEKSQLHSAELQRRLESQITEMQTEAKQRAFELSHMKVVLGEKENLLTLANLQIDMLQDKLQVSMDRYRALEADMNATNNILRKQPLGSPVLGEPAAAAGAPAGQQAVGMTAEQLLELRTLRREKEGLQEQVAELTAGLQAARETIKMASQPHGFLLQQLQQMQVEKQQAELKALAATTAMKAKEQEVNSVANERDALKADLDVLLQQRGQLEGLRSLLMRTLGAEAGGQAPGPAPARRPPVVTASGAPTTTIVGEGSG